MLNSAVFTSNIFTNTLSSMFTLPTIGLPSSFALSNSKLNTQFQKVRGALAAIGLLRGIPIYAYTHKENGENEIGRQILIRSTELGTQVITDNVAPLPRTWNIEGYLGMAKADFVVDFIGNKIATYVFLQAVKEYIRFLRLMRAPFQFTDSSGVVVDALIQSYVFEDSPISEYAVKLTLQLSEYVALSVDGNTYDVKNTPGLGSKYGLPTTFATAVSKSIASGSVFSL